jgi:hypothetical protein
MNGTGFNLVEAVVILRRTPTTVTAMLDGIPDRLARATEGDGTWSPYDVVGHLIHGERTDWIPRARHILAGQTSPFEPFDRSAQFVASADKSLEELLATFSEARTRNVAELVAMNLDSTDLQRPGRHPELGEVTLAQLLATWVVHDLDHVAQIARTMAKVYSEAVGPWQAYLSILQDRKT